MTTELESPENTFTESPLCVIDSNFDTLAYVQSLFDDRASYTIDELRERSSRIGYKFIEDKLANSFYCFKPSKNDHIRLILDTTIDKTYFHDMSAFLHTKGVDVIAFDIKIVPH